MLTSHIGPSQIVYSHARAPSDEVSPPPLLPHIANNAHCLQMLTIILDNLKGLVNPDGVVYTLASQATRIAHG